MGRGGFCEKSSSLWATVAGTAAHAAVASPPLLPAGPPPLPRRVQVEHRALLPALSSLSPVPLETLTLARFRHGHRRAAAPIADNSGRLSPCIRRRELRLYLLFLPAK